jgi:hypothetical protein
MTGSKSDWPSKMRVFPRTQQEAGSGHIQLIKSPPPLRSTWQIAWPWALGSILLLFLLVIV